MALAESWLGAETMAADVVRVAAVKAYLDRPSEALAAVARISFAALRLHTLFELTMASAGAADFAGSELARSLGSRAAEAYAGTAREGEFWPGLADAERAAVSAATGAAGGEAMLAQATAKLDGALATDARVRIYRIALFAAVQLGIGAWRALLERLLADKQLLRDLPERAHLLWELGRSTEHFADPEVRAVAIGHVGDALGRVPDLALRALVCAELARRMRGLPGRSPASWIGEARKVLVAQGSGGYLPKTLRLLAETDPAATLGIVRALKRPDERAICAIAVAEAASGIEEA